jgi:hypothetical protein
VDEALPSMIQAGKAFNDADEIRMLHNELRDRAFLGYATVIVGVNNAHKMTCRRWNPRAANEKHVKALVKSMQETGQRTWEHPVLVAASFGGIYSETEGLPKQMMHPSKIPCLIVPDGVELFLVNGHHRVEAATLFIAELNDQRIKAEAVRDDAKRDSLKLEVDDRIRNASHFIAMVYDQGDDLYTSLMNILTASFNILTVL